MDFVTNRTAPEDKANVLPVTTSLKEAVANAREYGAKLGYELLYSQDFSHCVDILFTKNGAWVEQFSIEPPELTEV